MSDLKKNIDRYMDIKGIKFYSDLLRLIAKELGEDPYDFPEKEKGNFSKMLKGERPLKHDFILPLEKIFGVSMARLECDEAYLLPLDKDSMPFIKGFRYYAYKDDGDLYENEFERTMITNEGYPTICNSDEFNKTFLDYVIQYRSINALRFLIKKHNLKPYFNSTKSYFIDERYSLNASLEAELFNMVIQEDDPDVFDSIYNPFESCIMYRTAFEQLPFYLITYELLLKSTNIFNSLFVPKEFSFKEFNRGIVGHDDKKIKLLNPFINECLDYALSNLDKYRDKARIILEFGIEYNKNAIEQCGENINDLTVREYGNVYFGNGHELLTNIIFPEYPIDDPELKQLFSKLLLPKYVKRA